MIQEPFDLFTNQGCSEDGLFGERLEMFLNRSIAEFAKRESRSEDNVTRHVAEHYCRKLFSFGDNEGQSTKNGRGILQTIVQALHSLCQVASFHYLLLAVDPSDEARESIVEGSQTGLNFWHGLRNGGTSGARSFKNFCMKSSSNWSEDKPGSPSALSSSGPGTGTGKRTPTILLKNKLYAEIRDTLRLSSGVANAEMKWSKPEKLSTYGVSMEGWPSDIPIKNPSQMTQQEIMRIYELIRNKEIRFLRVASSEPVQSGSGRCENSETNQGLVDQSSRTDEDVASKDETLDVRSPGRSTGSVLIQSDIGDQPSAGPEANRLDTISPAPEIDTRKRKRNLSSSD